MKILVACEESQRVCSALRKNGHEAYSCDIISCSGGHPEWHIKEDVSRLLNGDCSFVTASGEKHTIYGEWDMIIAFPPCTYLSNAGACRLYPKKGWMDLERFAFGVKAREFFMSIRNAKCEKICIENPVPSRVYGLPKPSQTIEPYEFGHPYKKKTYLWLKGLPKLTPTNIITEGITSWVNGGSVDKFGFQRENQGTTNRDPKIKSKTFEGIARAMADQWAGVYSEAINTK